MHRISVGLCITLSATACAQPGVDSLLRIGGLEAGNYHIELSLDDRERSYELHVPPQAADAAVPLVFSFHGVLSNPQEQAQRDGLDAQADEHGFAIVRPAGWGDSWNAGKCCLPAASVDVDDVGFVGQIARDVAELMAIDDSRIYATGFSNGAFLAGRLACEQAELFAGIAPVSGLLAVESCPVSKAMPVFHAHGEFDVVVPRSGDSLLGWPSADTLNQSWAQTAVALEPENCQLVDEDYVEGGLDCHIYARCNGEPFVELCIADGVVHSWPQAPADATGHFLRAWGLTP